MTVVLAVIVYLSAAALPRGRPAAIGIGAGLAAAGAAGLAVPDGEGAAAALYHLHIVLAAIGLAMAAVAQVFRLLLPRVGVLARAYPAVVLTVAVLAPVAARIVLG